MSTQVRNIVFILILAIIVVAGVVQYLQMQKGEPREGTERLTAEQVVDLEVQAEAAYKQSGGTY